MSSASGFGRPFPTFTKFDKPSDINEVYVNRTLEYKEEYEKYCMNGYDGYYSNCNLDTPLAGFVFENITNSLLSYTAEAGQVRKLITLRV